MQMGACELLMHYIDLKLTNDVQLTFEALKVPLYPRGPTWLTRSAQGVTRGVYKPPALSECP